MVDAVSMKNTENNGHGVVVNEESINMHTGISNADINIYMTMKICVYQCKHLIFLQGLGNHSVDLSKGC